MLRALEDRRLRFLVALGGWTVGLLAILRSPPGERALVAPFTAWHAAFASEVAGGSPVVVDLSCSGSDVIAVSIATILAFPAPWRRRFAGVIAGVVWLSGLNLLRVTTLVKTAATPLFVPLHLYVWPALMIGGSIAFVACWIFLGQRRMPIATDDFTRWRNVLGATVLLSIAYVALTPWLLASDLLQTSAIRLARGAAGALRLAGLDAVVGGSTLVVNQRSFLVTPECIVTPLMPLYLAWATTWLRGWRTRLGALLLFAPTFALLGELRLLTVSLPSVIGPPLFLTHGFYQFVVAILVIAIAARWHGSLDRRYSWRAYLACGLATAIAVAVLFGRPYTTFVDAASRLADGSPSPPWFGIVPPPDVQGATAIMPAFQLSLLCALSVTLLGRRAVRALVALIPVAMLLQIATLVAARDMSRGLGAEVPIMAIRVASLATPMALAMAAVAFDRRLQRHPARLAQSRG